MAEKRWDSKIYHSWAGMKARCLNEKNPNYHRYGARGIKVCQEWMQFDNFAKDMASSWKEGLSIDRINNDGNYEPGNCRWATRIQQAQNTRNVSNARKYRFNGLFLTIKEWAKKLGIKRSTLDMRLNAYGWPLNKALNGG